MIANDLLAGRELDRMIAEAMGWQELHVPWHINGGSGSEMWYDADGKSINCPPVFVHQGVTNLPMFSTEIIHAWIIIRYMEPNYDTHMIQIRNKWQITFEIHDGKIRMPTWDRPHNGDGFGEHRDFPLAVCRAFMDAQSKRNK